MENYPTIQRRDGTLFFACPEFDRGAIATSIERLIDMLDAMEDDTDLEPYLAGTGCGNGDDREADLDANGYPGLSEGDGNSDDEPMLGARESFEQSDWYSLATHTDEAEVENEHGGDIQDEPHDAMDEGNDEPSMGWGNPLAPTAQELRLMPGDALNSEPAECASLDFNGDGHHIARKMLLEFVKDHHKLARALDATRVSPSCGKYV